MLEVEESWGEGVYGEDIMCVVVVCIGQDDEKICVCMFGEMCRVDMGASLYSFVFVGDVMEIEFVMLVMYVVKFEDFYDGDVLC